MSKRARNSRPRWHPLAGAAIATIGPFAASMVYAESPVGFETRYFYQRTMVAELLIKEAIAKRSGDKALTLYNSLADEVQVLINQPKSSDACNEAFLLLIPVTLFAYGRLAPEHAFPSQPAPLVSGVNEQLDQAWQSYRERRQVCERLLDQRETARILPERLSEAF